jgi:hypothetical protein
MSIQIITGFSLNSTEPIDTRIVASGSTGRDAIPYKYQGLRVFDLSNNRPYVYVGATWSVEVSDQVLGTTGSIAKFSSSNTVGDSNIYQVGVNVGINTSNPLGSVQFGPSTVPFAGYSLPLVMHKAGAISGAYVSSTILGHNWYYSGSDQYFNSSVGSSTLMFGGSGDFIIQNRAGAAPSLISSLYISPLGKVGIGTGFSISSQPSQSLSVSGTVSATGFIGSGAGLTNISPSSISNQNLLSAGSSVTASNVFVTATTSNALHYLTFVSSGAWTSTPGSTNIKATAVAAGLSYNPSTNILNTGLINHIGGSVPTTAGGRINLLNLSTITSSPGTGNTSWLELSSVRNTTGSDWTTSSYRIHAKVDSVYQAYIQFNGPNNQYGISFGAGATDATNDYDKMRISSTGNVLIKNLGSVASPSISFIDDANTGIYSPLADNLAFVTGGVERFRVRSGAASDFQFKSLTGTRQLGLSVYDSGYTTLTLSPSAATTFDIGGYSGLVINGSLSKSSGSFRISHPLESKKSTHDLVHSFIEGPQADNIYRGKVTLDNGSATINLDIESNMSEGTFILLNREVQCFTTNETGWTAVKGRVTNNILQINSETTCSDEISWMVIGERHDKHMYDTEWTDDDGKVIVEPLKKLKEEI